MGLLFQRELTNLFLSCKQYDVLVWLKTTPCIPRGLQAVTGVAWPTVPGTWAVLMVHLRADYLVCFLPALKIEVVQKPMC